MNEIDKIKILNDLKEGQDTLILWKHFSKYLNIKKGKIEYTNDEIDELIEFFLGKEYFELCEKLKKFKL